MEYRKRKGSDTWHWCKNCTNWPVLNYNKKLSKPTSGELCDQCKGKVSNDNCTN